MCHFFNTLGEDLRFLLKQFLYYQYILQNITNVLKMSDLRNNIFPAAARYPPLFCSWKLGQTLSWIVYTSVTLHLLGSVFQILVIFQLLVLSIFGFSFVAYVTLERKAMLLSRYGNYHELYRMLSCLFVVFFWHPFVVSKSSNFVLPIATCIVPFFVGLHFTYIDGCATLQNLGCKLPLPSRWHTLRHDSDQLMNLI